MSNAAGAGSSAAAAAAASDPAARVATLETKIAALEAEIHAAKKSGDVLSNAALMAYVIGLQEKQNLLQKQRDASQASGQPAAPLTTARICAN